MKKILLVGVAVLVAVPVTSAFGGSGRDRATGGGQIMVSSGGGAGDTIAFTAQKTGGANNAAKGEVQYINRTGGTGKGQVVFHGDVICMDAEGANGDGMAEIAYIEKGDTSENPDVDQLYVLDAGEPNNDNDMIFVNEQADAQCALDDNDDDGQTALARGNAQVYDGD